jgi:hypothetical protein
MRICLIGLGQCKVWGTGREEGSLFRDTFLLLWMFGFFSSLGQKETQVHLFGYLVEVPFRLVYVFCFFSTVSLDFGHT